MLNETGASQLSDSEFKAMVTRKFNELTENYQKLQGNYNWTHCKLYQHEKGNRNYQQGPRRNEEYNFWTKNTVEGIKSWLHEAEDRISELEDKVEKNNQNEQEKEKRLRNNEKGLREMQNNKKRNNIPIRGIPEGEEEEQGITVWKSNDGKLP